MELLRSSNCANCQRRVASKTAIVAAAFVYNAGWSNDVVVANARVRQQGGARCKKVALANAAIAKNQ